MKQLLSYLRRYYHEEVNLWYFLTMGVILGVCIYFNYQFDFENSILDSFVYQPVHVPIMFCFYGSIYLVAVLLYAVFYKRTDFCL